MTDHSAEIDSPPGKTAADSAARFVSPTCGRLREWVKIAQPGARLTYAQGVPLANVCRSELRELVWELHQKGYLTPHCVKGTGGEASIHIVQRTHRQWLKGAAL